MANKTNIIPFRVNLARQLIRYWPFDRGSGRLARILLSGGVNWPKIASFRFRYGMFVDTPISPWPQGYRELLIYGEMEAVEVELWRRVLKAGDNVVDGGANYGYWSLVASHLVGKQATVHSFEPVPSTYASLQANIAASGATNVRTYPMALADKAGKCAMHLVENDSVGGWSSLRQLAVGKSRGSVEAKSIVLSQLLHNEPVRLIKLDIEGGELAALKGATLILEREQKPVITFEWNRTTSSAFGYTPEAIGDFLHTFGYALFIHSRKGLIPFNVKAPKSFEPGWTPMVWALTAKHQSELRM